MALGGADADLRGRRGGERLALCLLVDSGRLYRFPYENARGIKSLAIKARFVLGEMEYLRLREFQPGLCRYVNVKTESRIS